MANLRANKITSTEVFETTGSVQFDGSGDYLSLAVSSDFQFGSEDFTIECWAYTPSTDTKDILGIYNTGANRRTFALRKDQTESVQFLYSSNGTSGISVDSEDGIIDLNQWNHYVVVRKDLEYIIYLKGIRVASQYNTDAIYNNTSDGLRIGSSYNTDFEGHISNVRILKGQALYTENFTPPTRELTVIPNTVLLACQSTTNTAQVANELTPGLLTDVVKSGGTSAITGSVEFDGTGDYLQTTSSDYALGTDDFTLEFWVNYSTKSVPGTPVILDDESTTYAPLIGYPSGSPGNAVLYMSSSGSSWDISSGTSFGPITGNSWVHLALTRKGSTFYLFYNGVLANTISSSASVYQSANTITAGYAQATAYFQGFISNLRIVKGTALYTSDFIPPTRELKNIPGTVLLCCKNSNDPTAEETGKTITPYGSLDRTDLGIELVTNGTFDTDTTGWTISDAGEGSMTVTSGQLVLSNNDTTDPPVYAYQGIVTKIGSTYRVSADIVGGTASSHAVYLNTSSTFGNVYGAIVGGVGATPTNYVQFVATTTTTYILLRVNANQVATSIFDNVSAIKLDPGIKPPFTPSIGFDGSVEFAGPTKINSENYFYLPTGNTESRDLSGGHRGLFMGGNAGSQIEYITISNQSNALDFGDLSLSRTANTAASSSTRGISAGGFSSPLSSDVIDYVTIASTGDAQDFGDLTEARRNLCGLSNSTRGIFGGGTDPGLLNTIDYITIPSTGSAQDFGNLNTALVNLSACSSPTRGIIGGGESPGAVDIIQYITIPSKGDTQNFGDLTGVRSRMGSCSSNIRGLFGSGRTPAQVNTIDYVTIASTGNAQDFGDVTDARESLSGTSDNTRGIFAGGYPNTNTNLIEFVIIQSMGNAFDFGDLITATREFGACSNGHGGLG
jgi:hypothetical protein